MCDVVNAEELRKRFDALADEWLRHCNSVVLSSTDAQRLNHQSYRELVKLGKSAVPLIVEHLAKDDARWDVRLWEHLLEDVTEVQMIPDRGHYRPTEVRKQCLEWWNRERDEWIKKYCSGQVTASGKQTVEKP
jgi:hypothetical protein